MIFSTPVKEDLVQYVWLTKKLDIQNLKTVTGESVEIIKWGTHNYQSGPDFLGGKIKVNNLEWYGNVEMHTLSSRWLDHNHQKDPNYDNVILHVVYEHDRDIFRNDGTIIPTIEIKDRIPAYIKRNYFKLMQNKSWVPCSGVRPEISKVLRVSWLESLMVERLKRKSNDIYEILQGSNNDWNQVSWEFIAKYFGMKVNAQPMIMVANGLPINHLLKLGDDIIRIEASLLGVAGLLNSSFKDEYALRLKNEFQFLEKKYNYKSIDPSLWKFGGIRPANFPTIRLAQLAQLIRKKGQLFHHILECKGLKDLKYLLEIETTSYWDEHYRLDKKSTKRRKRIGSELVKIIGINVVAPIIFTYGLYQDEEKWKNQALELLSTIDSESNRIIKGWNKEGIESNSALESQALIQLKTEYCDKIKCLSCRIGHNILNITE